MARRTIYVPDEMDARLVNARFNVSRVCQEALEQALVLDEAQPPSVAADVVDDIVVGVALRLRALVEGVTADQAAGREGRDDD